MDNASTDGSRDYLRTLPDIRTTLLPVNVGHGIALDLVLPLIDTEYVAILDIDAFPIAPDWLDQSIAAVESGAKAAGALLHRNFIHPSFFVSRTQTLHAHRLTFRSVGTLAHLDQKAPLFLDVGEALSQRLLIKYGGGSALHFFHPTSTKGPGLAGSVFGGIVYHNLYATQGRGADQALMMFTGSFEEFHPDLARRF